MNAFANIAGILPLGSLCTMFVNLQESSESSSITATNIGLSATIN